VVTWAVVIEEVSSMKKEEKKDLLWYIQNLDRRVIYVILVIAVIIPLIYPLGLPIPTSDKSENFYNLIQNLKPGSKILFSCDYNPSGAPELQPMNEAILKHCFTLGHKIYFMGLWDQGPALATNAIDSVIKSKDNAFPPKVYGEDYINLGYKAGGYAVIMSMAKSEIQDIFNKDVNNNPISNFPMMKEVNNLKSFDLVLGLTGGNNGVIDAWLPVANAIYGMKVAAGCSSVSAPQFYQYTQTGQLSGLIEGIKGCAEYESLLFKRSGIKNAAGKGTSSIDVQSVIHLVIMFFIIIANTVYFLDKKRKGAMH
jgi:hypothetical protein